MFEPRRVATSGESFPRNLRFRRLGESVHGMSDPSMLPAGTFLGQRLRSVRVGPLVVEETAYAAHEHLPGHGHAHLILCFVSAGGWEERLAGRRRWCERWQLLVRPAGEVHAQTFGTHPSRCLAIEANASALEHHHLSRRLVQPAQFIANDATRLVARRMADELRHQDPSAEIAIEGLWLELVAEVLRARPSSVGRLPTFLARAKDLVDANWTRRISLAWLAEELGVTAWQVGDAFRRGLGLSVAAYVRRQRIEAARRLLAADDGSLSAVALQLGFFDQSHFTRTFVRVMGQSPSAYRAGIRTRGRR
jgi:AraC family transcriptional regulator